MLIGIDSSPCSLSLKTEVCSTTKCHQNKSDLKNFFVQKSFFFQYLLFFQSQLCLLESTVAIFRQSAGYVYLFLIKILIAAVKLSTAFISALSFYTMQSIWIVVVCFKDFFHVFSSLKS